MKAILEFDTAEPYENGKLHEAIKATNMTIALWDIDRLFFNKLKYDEELSESQYIEIEKLQTEFYNILKNQDVEFILNG